MPAQTAKVLTQDVTAVTFAVDDVIPAETPLECIPLRDKLEKTIFRPVLACSNYDRPVVKSSKLAIHPLIHAVLTAFGEHRPLCLRPDDIWLTIAQGFSFHVRQHAEALRHRFVRHEGKITLIVEGRSIRQVQDWENCIPRWAAGIREELLDPAIHDAMACDFTTTTPEIRFASQIVFLETFKRYFNYVIEMICGIPTVTLCGSPEDWQTIRSRVTMLAQYDLDWWVSRLLPICDALITTSQGRPPLKFWQAIFAPKDAYEGPEIKGWIADLFPYIGEEGNERNPLFDVPPGNWHRKEGLTPARFPSGKSYVPVEVSDASDQKQYFELIGGFLGVSQDNDTHALSPEIGWGILQQHFAKALVQEAEMYHLHDLRPYERSDITDERFDRLNKDASKVYPVRIMTGGLLPELYRCCDGGTLYAGTDHPWIFLSHREVVLSTVDPELFAPDHCARCFTFLALPDGRHIAAAIITDDISPGFHRNAKNELRIILGHPTQEMREREIDLMPNFEEWSEEAIEEYKAFFPKEEPFFTLFHYPASTTCVLHDNLDGFFEQIRRAEGRYFFDELT